MLYCHNRYDFYICGKKLGSKLRNLKNISIIFSSSRATKEVLNKTFEVIDQSGSNICACLPVNKLATKLAKEKISKSDLILVIGGDGTMIGSIRELNELNIPFLGINLGRVGFLTDINPNNIVSLEKILKGQFIKEKRPIFQASTTSKKKEIFINEVVIHSGSVAKMIDLEISAGRESIYQLKADGIIVSSPTGSTAYSYSGGGPVVSPKVNALTLLPMFSHSSSSHSLLMPENKNIEVKIKNTENLSAEIVLDAKKIIKYTRKGISISKTKKYFYLYHPKDYNYFEACRTKLGWAFPIENIKND